MPQPFPSLFLSAFPPAPHSHSHSFFPSLSPLLTNLLYPIRFIPFLGASIVRSPSFSSLSVMSGIEGSTLSPPPPPPPPTTKSFSFDQFPLFNRMPPTSGDDGLGKIATSPFASVSSGSFVPTISPMEGVEVNWDCDSFFFLCFLSLFVC